MTPQINTTSKLEVLKERLLELRRTGRLLTRIPENFWKSAVELTKESSCKEVSKYLNLDLRGLKRRVERISLPNDKKYLSVPDKQKFIELKMPVQQNERCFIEIDSTNGCKMRMQFSGENNGILLDIVKTFIGREI